MAEISRLDGTAIGNMTSNGGLAAAFDGDTNQDNDHCARGPANTNDTTCGKDWGVGVSHIITRYTVYANNNYKEVMQGTQDNNVCHSI